MQVEENKWIKNSYWEVDCFLSLLSLFVGSLFWYAVILSFLVLQSPCRVREGAGCFTFIVFLVPYCFATSTQCLEFVCSVTLWQSIVILNTFYRWDVAFAYL